MGWHVPCVLAPSACVPSNISMITAKCCVRLNANLKSHLPRLHLNAQSAQPHCRTTGSQKRQHPVRIPQAEQLFLAL